MAGYRQFHTQFWKDEWLIDLEPLERYLFSYLFTNDLSSISGIYKLPMRVIVNETGLEKDFISRSLAKFQTAHKIFYKDGVMWVLNMRKYHKNASPRTMAKVNNDVREIPDCDVKTAYLYYEKTGIYCIDIVSILRSESVSESVSVSVSVSEGNEPTPAPPIPFADYGLRVFNKVTGMFSIPDTEKVIPALEGLYYQHGKDEEKLIAYLKPFYQAWITRKNKNGRTYSKAHCGWLYEWAVAGEIPPANSSADDNKPKMVPKIDPYGNIEEFPA